jgi:2-iminobutanoate/2-iminopropanoate deaminase
VAEKEIVRTERAPAPFEGAPYNQAVRVGGLVFVAGQLGLAPDGTGMVGGGVAEQTEQAMQNLSAILASGEQSGATRQDDRLPAEPRRLRGHERGVCDARRRTPAGQVDGGGGEAPSGALVEIEAIAHV